MRQSKKPDRFYTSSAWQRVRWHVLKRDGFACVVCGRSVQGKGQARVDHIQPRKQHPDLALTLSNLRTLCPPCDNARHADKGGQRRAAVGLDGLPVGGKW